VVFKPFKGEIMIGKVRSCTEHGVYASLGFFEDVFIPASELQQPSTFARDEALWKWAYSSTDDPNQGFFSFPFLFSFSTAAADGDHEFSV
jgi:DNA-directed RNA polymerase III subunit RPC8